jgi:hypothetical protein
MKPDSHNGEVITTGIPVATTATQPASRLVNSKWLKAAIVAIVIGATAFLYYSAFQPERFGFYRDDSLYVVMARALATGQGYRIISIPNEPIQTKSPPVYPFLLSLIWKLKPQFPQNLTAMMLLTISIAIAFLGLTYRYLIKHAYATRWQAIIVIGLTAINWRTIVLASGIYSEMVYAALSVAALYLAEKYGKTPDNWALGSAVGVVTGLAFLTRSAGLALLPAMALYFFIRRERKGVLPIIIASMLVFAWMGWGYLNSPTIENSNSGSYESYLQTLCALLDKEGQSGIVALLSVIARNALGLILISIPVVCLGLAYESVLYFGFAFLFIAAGFYRQSRARLRLMHIYVVTYLAVHLLWPFTSYDRFLMPLLPFLLLFLLIEGESMLALIRKSLTAQTNAVGRASAGFICLALFVAVGASLYNYGLGVYRSLGLATLNKVNRPSTDDAGAIEWVTSNTDPGDVLICYRDPLYYLHTGRKAVRSSVSREGGSLQSSEVIVDDEGGELLRIIKENNARYLVITPSDFGLEFEPDLRQEGIRKLVQRQSKVFVPVFEQAEGGAIIYRIDPGDL